MRRTTVSLVMVVCVLSATAANAAITLFDIDANPAAWAVAVAGMTPTTAYNLDLDADYGIIGSDGPLTSAGGTTIASVEIYDLSDGAEGVQGLGTTYDSAHVIPVPGSLLLGSLGMGLVGWIRRRRTL